MAEKQEMAASLAAAKGNSMDVGVVADLSELDAIYTLIEEQKNSNEGFSYWTTPFHFASDWLCLEFR